MTQYNVGFHGKRRLRHSPGEVRGVIDEMLKTGTLLAVMLEGHDGSIGVQVFGEPDPKVLDALEAAVDAYREALKQYRQ